MTKHEMTKANYKKTFELCVITAVVMVFGLLHAFPGKTSRPVLGDLKKIELTIIEDIPQTFQHRKPIPPRQPAVPLPVVGQEFPENQILEAFEFDLSGVTPPPALKTSTYDEFVYIPHEIPPYPKKGYDFLNQLVEYPPFALKKNIEGRVILGILVDENGQPEKVTIIEPSGRDAGFETAALRAAQKIEWFPAKQRGKAVKVWVALPVKFEVVKENLFGLGY
jgi:TonB family protein